MAGGRQQLIQYPWVSLGPVGRPFRRGRSLAQRAGKESASDRQIPLLQQQNIHDLPDLVNGAIEVDPPTGDRDRGFVHEPAISWSVPARLSRVDEPGRETLHPAVDRHVINVNTALSQQLFPVSIGEPIPQIPPDRHQNRLQRKLKPGKTRPGW
jgi:hypothetical protein